MQTHPSIPMNDEPITYPTVTLAELSEDAHTLLRAVHEDSRLEFDPLASNARRPYDRPEGKVAVSERLRAAIEEVVASGHGTWNEEYQWMHTTRAHGDYTVAVGRGTQFARVYLLRYPGDRDGLLLAVALGADLTSSHDQNGHTSYRLRARHEDATDFEHDASSVLDIKIDFAHPPTFGDYGRVELTGVATEIRAYPLGMDPLDATDVDNRSPREVCDSEHCDPHPFAPFLPPVLNLPTRAVRVELLPLRTYQVAAPPAFATPTP